MDHLRNTANPTRDTGGRRGFAQATNMSASPPLSVYPAVGSPELLCTGLATS